MICLFLTLRTFSATGGIEKVSRIAGKALAEIIEKESGELHVYSMYDGSGDADARYISPSIFSGFGQKKIAFTAHAIAKGVKSDVVVLSHLNLLIIGYIIKLLSAKTRFILYTHGIEAWQPLPLWKRKLLKKVDCMFAVSHFTRNKMVSLQGVDENMVKVLNNCLDPFLPEPASGKDEQLTKKYGLKKDAPVLLTLSRLSSHDRDKGYDKVLRSVKDLKAEFPTLKYIIAGKYEPAEKAWLDELIEAMKLKDAIIFTGYVKDEELAAHFSIADVYIMPSIKEGFGIIFIEAMYYGLPVIAGNKDGSVDALCNGELGVLVDPDNQQEINNALRSVLLKKSAYVPDKRKLLDRFGYDTYKRNFQELLHECLN